MHTTTATTTATTTDRRNRRLVRLAGAATLALVLAGGAAACGGTSDDRAVPASLQGGAITTAVPVGTEPVATVAPEGRPAQAPAPASGGGSGQGSSAGGSGQGGAPQPQGQPSSPAPTLVLEHPESIDCHNGMFQQFTLGWSTTGAVRVTVSIDGPGVYQEYAPNASDTLPFNCSSPHTFLVRAYAEDGQVTEKSVTLYPRNVDAQGSSDPEES
jgi:hypothetical protein